MPSYTGVVDADDKSPDAVFAYLAAFEHTSEWDPACERAERVTPGEPALGSQFKLVFKPAGPVPLTLEYEIVEFDDAARRIVLRGGNTQMHSEDIITVEQLNGGCRVTYEAEIGLNGPGKLLDPLVGLGFDRAGRAAQDGLRARLARPL